MRNVLDMIFSVLFRFSLPEGGHNLQNDAPLQDKTLMAIVEYK